MMTKDEIANQIFHKHEYAFLYDEQGKMQERCVHCNCLPCQHNNTHIENREEQGGYLEPAYMYEAVVCDDCGEEVKPIAKVFEPVAELPF